MTSKIGKEFRLSEISGFGDKKSLIIRADHGMTFGPISTILDWDEIFQKIIKMKLIDSIILSPGQAKRHLNLFKGKFAPKLLLKIDWSNVFRTATHYLPAERITHVKIASAEDALLIGASGAVAYYFIGYERDEDEARHFESLGKFVNESNENGMPLIVEVIPIGKKIDRTRKKYAEIIGLGVRMAVEAGADMIFAPFSGSIESFRNIVEIASVPIFMLDLDEESTLDKSIEDVRNALEANARGAVFGRKIFESKNPVKTVETLHSIIHE